MNCPYPYSYSIESTECILNTRKYPSHRPSPTRGERTLPPLMGGIKGGCGTLFEKFQIRKRFFGSSSAHLFQRSKTQANRGPFWFVIDEATIMRTELYAPYIGRLAVP